MDIQLQQREARKDLWVGLAIALGFGLGIVFGTVLGVRTDNISMGIGIGLVIGGILGVGIGGVIWLAYDQWFENKSKPALVPAQDQVGN